MTVERALITGAGSGIGAEVARALAARGASVGLLDRNPEGLEATAEDIRARYGLEAVSAVADVSDDHQMTSAIGSLVDRLGGLSTVVACAGIETYGDVLTAEVDMWERTLAVNLTGMFLTARHTIGPLLESGGTFTAIASDAGVMGAVGYSAYVSSKHAVVGLIKCMALDFGPRGVRSNVVCPSFVETPMADRIFAESAPAEIAYYKSSVPLGRFAQPREIADVVMHLSSPAASYVNGLVYAVDGGATAGYAPPPSGLS